jgi:hypothetical protein
MLRRTIQIGGTLLLAAVAFVAVWIATHLDDPAIDDSDLRISRPDVPDAENGMALLERAAAELWWPEEHVSRLDDLRSGKSSDEALEREVIARNERVFAAVPAILAAPVFVVPALDPEHDLKRALAWQRPSALLAIRAARRARGGDADGAVSDALAAASLGARIESGTGVALLQSVFGATAKWMGLRALGRVLAEVELDAAESRELTARLATLRIDTEAWRRMWAFEYENTLELMARVDAAASPSPSILERYTYHPNATKALFADGLRIYAQQGSAPCARARWPAAPPSGGDRLGPLLGPNSVGRMLSWVALSDEPTLRRCEHDSRVEATRAWVALRAYSHEHGALPTRLEELVPTYITEVPFDAFDGEPLRYDHERRLLWSIGRDFVDAGGVEDEKGKTEPVFPIPF